MAGTSARAPLWGLFDPAIRPDPYPLYDELRTSGPIHHDPAGAFLLTRHRDCVALLRHARFGHGRQGEAERRRQFLFLNPPEHTRLRGLVSKAFTHATMNALRDRVRHRVGRLLERASPAGEVDLITEFAYPLPVGVICELLGVPPEDHALFHTWSHDLTLAFDPDFDFAQPAEVLARRDRARAAFAAYFLELAGRRRAQPANDLISGLAPVLGDEELVITCELLLVAGHETTVNLIGNGTLALLRHPDQLDLLRGTPSLIGSAVEELLRYDSPVQYIARTALADAEFAGTRIPAGDLVIALIAAANRDPAVFHDPHRLDITRRISGTLVFGHGAHFCLGAPLARLEGRISLAALAALPGLALAGEPVYRDNPVLRGPASLPVRLR
ncbi:MAG: cytochrome P450 [Pseudonocardiales bacterium]|nr:cytochrome P450 [Pseudonocardiales bacterium]MBV9031441.1 cytochrome P450 [Pseudonocardiales bacterium]MBW0010351.1 cytochrome P450 [Pseudonocardiales bacterium]